MKDITFVKKDYIHLIEGRISDMSWARCLDHNKLEESILSVITQCESIIALCHKAHEVIIEELKSKGVKNDEHETHK